MELEMSDEVANHATKNRLVTEAEILVAIRKTLVEGGFSTEQAYDLIETMLNRDPEPDGDEGDEDGE